MQPGSYYAHLALGHTLRQRGELYYYESPEAHAVSPEYKDPGYWSAARLVTVGLAYAIASRLARQAGAGLGDRSDLYGGIGANGSVGSDAIELVLMDRGSSYTFLGSKIYNLKADDYIQGHSDVTNPEVVNALAQAMGLR